MRIVTYNINGLRARLVPPRSLLGFLDSLDTDIICLQETMITRQELTADIAIAGGYESFFSCTRTVVKGRVGYFGVATFCRTSTAVPLAADEGFTGLLHVNRFGVIEGGKARVGCYEEVLKTENLSTQELLQLDREGRCLVTDHGSFVLFNLYGPCDNEERYDFKLRFYRALQNRWDGLLKAGRRVIAVGDFSISPFPVDFCNPGPDFDKALMRQWLRSQLRDGGGPFLDAFRVIHPSREGAYRWWNQSSGAEEFNFGSRIDLILAAGFCFHLAEFKDSNCKVEENHHFGACEVEGCDVLQQFKRFKADSLPRRGREKYEKLEGSDHAPVYVQLRTQPPVDQHDASPLAARFMPELGGRRQSIEPLFQKRPAGSEFTDIKSCTEVKEVKLKKSSPTAASVKKEMTKAATKIGPQKGKQKNLWFFYEPAAAEAKENTEDVSIVPQPSDSETPVKTSLVQGDDQPCTPFLADYSCTPQISSGNILSLSTSQAINGDPVDWSPSTSTSELEKSSFETSTNLAAKAELQRIQNTMRVPMCSGHNEPCATRTVKKAGSNFGRTFYCCARAQDCNYFQWITPTRAQIRRYF